MRSDPAASPSRSGAVDLAALRWPEVLDVIKRSSKVTHALMETVQVAGWSGNDVHLDIDTPGLARMLGDRRHTDVIAAAMAELLDGTWTISVGVAGEQAARATPVPCAPAQDEPSVGPAEARAPGGWPTVTTVPGEEPSDADADATVPPAPARRAPSRSAARQRSASPAERAAHQPAAADLRDQEPDGFDDEPGDHEAPAARHDPEAEALALLETGLGARPVDG